MNYKTSAGAEASQHAVAEFVPVLEAGSPLVPVVPEVGVWTTQALIDNCAAWRPDIAAKQRDSSLCVSDVICAVEVNGVVKELHLVNARWASIYIRVSTDAQRSGKSNRTVADGFSELHQLRSCIEWCIFHGYAFKIYSDAGITSSYPPDDGRLIRGLLKAKAERYRKAFDRVWLSDSTKANYPPEQVVSMTQYRDAMVTKIKTGPFTDGSNEVGIGDRRNSRVYHRQALTQLWRDIECQSTHLVVVTDKSRLFRSADLEMLFYELAHDSRVGIQGTEESILSFDISEPEQKGTLYLLASFNEKKLYDALYNSLKGVAESILGGKPHAKLPFWLCRDENGNAVIIEDNVPLIHRIIELCFEDAGGPGAISAKLFAEGRRTADGHQVTTQMVRGVLEDESIAGIHRHFGWG